MIVRSLALAAAIALPGSAPAQGVESRADLLKAAESGRASALIAAIDGLSSDRSHDRRTEGLAVYLWAGYGLEAVALSPEAWAALARCFATGVPRACDAPGAAANGRAMLTAMTAGEPLAQAAARLAPAVGRAAQAAPGAVEQAVGFPIAAAAQNVRALDLQLTALLGPDTGAAPAPADCARLAGALKGPEATAPLTGRGYGPDAAEGWLLASPSSYDTIAAIRRSCPAFASQFAKAAVDAKVRAAVRHAPAEVCGQRVREAYLEASQLRAYMLRGKPALQTRFTEWNEVLRISRLSPGVQTAEAEASLEAASAFPSMLEDEAARAPVHAEMVELLAAACPDPAVERQVLPRIRTYADQLASANAAAQGPRRCTLAVRRLLHVDAIASVRGSFEGATGDPALAPATAAVEQACHGQGAVLQPLAAMLPTTRLVLARNAPACKQALDAVDAAGAAFDGAVGARDRARANTAYSALQSAWKGPLTACPAAARDLQAAGDQTLRQALDMLGRL